jgi:hypothetical protein
VLYLTCAAAWACHTVPDSPTHLLLVGRGGRVQARLEGGCHGIMGVTLVSLHIQPVDMLCLFKPYPMPCQHKLSLLVVVLMFGAGCKTQVCSGSQSVGSVVWQFTALAWVWHCCFCAPLVHSVLPCMMQFCPAHHCLCCVDWVWSHVLCSSSAQCAAMHDAVLPSTPLSVMCLGTGWHVRGFGAARLGMCCAWWDARHNHGLLCAAWVDLVL